MMGDSLHKLSFIVRCRRGASHATFLRRVLFVFVFSTACLCLDARAQQQREDGPVVQTDQTAPLMKYVPEEDRAQIAREGKGLKDRTRAALEVADARLSRATQFTVAGQFDAAAKELGIYQALIEDLMRFLTVNSDTSSGKVSNKTRDLFKKVEMALRAHGPRIETIRRTTPSEDAANVRSVYEFTRRTRSEALNTFYGETVLREGSDRKEASTGNEQQRQRTRSSGNEQKKDAPPNP